MTTTGAIDEGRSSFARLAWRDAYMQLAAADAESPLELDDLERLALAAYLIGAEDASTAAWTRAHQEAQHRGDPRRAARYAFLIGSGLMFRGEVAPALGWLARGGRVLEGLEDCAEHAWLLTLNGLLQMFGGEPATVEPILAECVGAGQRYGDLDLMTMARVGQGMCKVMQGQDLAGLALLDEAMVAVTSGQVSPVYSGMTYCTVIEACSESFDLRRAREWTAALTRWCDAQPDLVPFRGNCLVHRCALMQLEGAWSEATEAAQQACDVLSGPIKWDSLGSAYYQLGELQRLRGESTLAEASYRRAADNGRAPEPGLALLRLAEGHVGVAASMMRRALDETEAFPARSRLLAAYVEVMLAAGDASSASAGAEELTDIAEVLDATYLHALAATATGAVLVAVGDAHGALPKLRMAGSAWRGLDAPHETARVRVLIGLACRALGDPESSAMEFDGARRAFEKLGAEPDIERLDAVMIGAGGPVAGGLTVREVEVLKLVASGTTNRSIARDLGLSEKTVARHLSNIFSKIGVPSRAAATAYAYKKGLV